MGGNLRTRRKPTTFGRVLTNSSHVRSDVQSQLRTPILDLSDDRPSLRQLSHVPFFPPPVFRAQSFGWLRQNKLLKVLKCCSLNPFSLISWSLLYHLFRPLSLPAHTCSFKAYIMFVMPQTSRNLMQWKRIEVEAK